MLTKDLLDEWVYYESGNLFWKKKPCNWINIGDKIGNKTQNGYIQSQIRGVKFLVHRAIFLLHHGYLPSLVDHIDRNPLNNNIDNLREASKRENANNTGVPKNNKSGVKGVSWCKINNKWVVRYKIGGKYLFCGYFINKSDAIIKRRQMEEIYE